MPDSPAHYDVYYGVTDPDNPERLRRLRAHWGNLLFRTSPYTSQPKQFEYWQTGRVVCDRWARIPEGFPNYYADLADTWFPGAQLSRIGDSGPYAPDNCRWLSALDNQHEKRNVTKYVVEGETLFFRDIMERAEAASIARTTLANRLRRGHRTWEKLLAPPNYTRGSAKVVEGETLASLGALYAEVKKRRGDDRVSYAVVAQRYEKGDRTWDRLCRDPRVYVKREN